MEQSELKTSVRAAKHGSAQAFGRLYEHYAAELYRFALWYLHNASDAEDAVQEAVLSAWRNIRALRKEEAFKAWLFQILANACKNQLQMKSGLRLVSMEESGMGDRLACAPTFENDAVGSLLGSLSPEDRAIVTMAVLGVCVGLYFALGDWSLLLIFCLLLAFGALLWLPLKKNAENKLTLL